MNHSLWVAPTPGTLIPVVNTRLRGSPLWTLAVGFWRPASNSTILLIWSQKVFFKLEESIAYQPDICMGLFPPVATLLVLSNQPLHRTVWYGQEAEHKLFQQVWSCYTLPLDKPTDYASPIASSVSLKRRGMCLRKDELELSREKSNMLQTRSLGIGLFSPIESFCTQCANPLLPDQTPWEPWNTCMQSYLWFGHQLQHSSILHIWDYEIHCTYVQISNLILFDPTFHKVQDDILVGVFRAHQVCILIESSVWSQPLTQVIDLHVLHLLRWFTWKPTMNNFNVDVTQSACKPVSLSDVITHE